MKVYFAPCGIGLGHVGRVAPIARKLAEKNAEIVFSTYREGVDYVSREGFPLIRAPPIGFQVKPDGSVDFRQTAVNPGPFFASFTLTKQVNSEVGTIQHFKPDVIVSDSRVSPLIAGRVLRIPRICVLNQFQPIIPRTQHYLRLARLADSVTLTIIGKMWTSGNTVLIPDFPPPYTVCAGNLTIPRPYRKNVKLIGPILPTHPSELPTKEQLRAKLLLPEDKPLIFVSISGPTSEKAFVTGILRKILMEFPEDYQVVVSYGYPSADTVPIRHRNVTLYKWIPNRFEYLKACDLIVARAGHGTITQCMCYGKPMILVPTPNHTEQLTNARQAQNLGIAKIILQERLTREKLLASVRELLQAETATVTAVQEEALKHNGLQNAVNTIVRVAQKEASVLG
jgi:UDP-N-acetylglucosamine--N-acetylmuramyl-(pentapeptide) pyrophosphoryl-undecaprenol N-acetylglucosamine transferase